MMKWEVVIGLETHTQLLTQSKIFSGDGRLARREKAAIIP